MVLFGQKNDLKSPISHYSKKGFTKINFSKDSKHFSNIDGSAQPGSQIVPKKFKLMVNTDMFTGIKTMFRCCWYFF